MVALGEVDALFDVEESIEQPQRRFSGARLRSVAWWRGIVLFCTGAFFLIPIYAALRFSLEGPNGTGFTLSAYATAEALTSGSIPLTSIQIGSFLNGNVIAGEENVGKALGLGLIVVAGIVMFFYSRVQKRASRWLR